MTPRARSSWVLVTGASKGIGAATARQLAADGHDVLVHYGRDADGAAATAATCEEQGVAARTVQGDLAADGAERILAAVEDVGGVHALVSNAGVTADGLALRLDDAAFQLPMQVHVNAAFALARGVLRGMVRARAGRLVFVSSVIGLHGGAGQANYAASKAALIGLTKSLAREVGSRGITSNAVAPGYVATAMTAEIGAEGFLDRIPAGRVGDAEEVAACIAFLCSDAAAYVNGTVLQVDGGLFA